SIVAEAARAIYDVPILSAMEALAVRLERPLPGNTERPLPGNTERPLPAAEYLYLTRRAVCANRKLGGEACARRIVAWLRGGDGPEAARAEALDFLARWADPLERDPVTGEYAPVHRGGDDLSPILPELAASLRAACTVPGSGRVTRAWIRLVGASGAEACVPSLHVLLEGEGSHGSQVRRAALATLAEREFTGFEDAVRRALVDEDDAVRGEAFARLAAFDEAEAIRWIEPALDSSRGVVRQSAFASLGGLKSGAADRLLVAWVDRLAEGSAPAEVALEILEAAAGREDESVARALERYRGTLLEDDALAAWRACLVGGDARAGRRVFFENAEVSCLKCHKLGDEGGSEAGPDLSDVGTRLSREELLEAIVLPNAKIATGFENWIFQLDDDTVVAGRLLGEDEATVTIEVQEGGETVVLELDASAVTARKRDLSSMPEDVAEHLSRRALRDVVEFLASRE
ncbi:MAG: c-type cytochrome, partial [Planctomycetota bacterium]